jgi:hypothetical protein
MEPVNLRDASDEALSLILQDCQYSAERIRAEMDRRAEQAKPKHDINVRRLNLVPDDVGDYGFPVDQNPHGIRVFRDEVKDGRNLPRLMRAVDLAPCMADFVEKCGRVDAGSWPHGMFEKWCWLADELTGDQTPRTKHADAARAAGWIA